MQRLTVSSFGFAPMKGTRHLPQTRAEVGAAGPVGDRRLCLVDDAVRRVLKTSAHPELISVACLLTGDTAVFTFADGVSAEVSLPPGYHTETYDYWGRPVCLQVFDHPVNKTFSALVGTPVWLAVAQPGDIVFGAPFSLIGTATLTELARQTGYTNLPAEHARFRSTFLVETQTPFVEDRWAGQTVQLEAGEGVPANITGLLLKVTAPIGRCSVIDANPASGVRDLKLLKHLARIRPRGATNEPLAGMFACLVSLPKSL